MKVVHAGGPSRTFQRCIAIVLVGAIAACQLAAQQHQSFVLVGAGSSVPLPLYRKWSEVYNQRNPTIQMNYVPLGTSEGIVQISKRTSDFGAGEVLLSADQRAKGDLIELPVALIGIVPVYNLPGVKQELRFSGSLLAEIFLGEVKSWDDPQVLKLNPGAALPHRPISVVYRPGGKGTNYVLSEFLSQTSPKFRSKIGRTPSPHWPVGAPAERSSDMVDKVKSTPGSIGYVELRYAVAAGLAQGAVLNPAGRYVKASPESIMAACRAVEGEEWQKLAVSLTNAPGANSFPITSFTWLYVQAHPVNPARATALADLMDWIFSDGQRIAMEEGYPNLPAPLLLKVRAHAHSIR
jgi:phosphate transport system substrate-binding protein